MIFNGQHADPSIIPFQETLDTICGSWVGRPGVLLDTELAEFVRDFDIQATRTATWHQIHTFSSASSTAHRDLQAVTETWAVRFRQSMAELRRDHHGDEDLLEDSIVSLRAYSGLSLDREFA